MDKKITFLERLKRSILDFTFYGDVAVREPASESVKFYFLFLLLLSFIFSCKFAYMMNLAMGDIQRRALKDFPKVSIRQGKIHTSTNKPYKKAGRDFWLFVDPAGTVKNTPGKYPQEILVTHGKIKIYTPKYSQEFDISKVREFSIDRETISGYLKAAVFISFPFIALIIYLGVLAVNFLKLMIFSLLSLIFNAILDTRLTYQALLTLGVYSLSASSLVSGAVFLSGLSISFKHALILLVYVFYLYNAVKSTKQKTPF